MKPAFYQTLVLTIMLSLTAIIGILTVLPQKAPAYCFKVKIADRGFVERKYYRPNPLMLIVFVDEHRNIRVNMRNCGTLDDTSEFKRILSDTFQLRHKYDVYREANSIEIEKTIIVSSSNKLKYAEIIRLIDDLKGVGAEPIELKITGYFDKW